MKYNIRINQKAIIQNEFDIDVIDAIILDFITEYVKSGSLVSINDEGSTFYWISHGKISEELPILKMAKNTIYKRMKKLCEKGFLVQSKNSQLLGRSFYAISEKANKIKFIDPEEGQRSDLSDNIPEGGSKSDATDENPKGSENDPKPSELKPKPSENNPNDNNSLNNNSKNNNSIPKGISKKKKSSKTSKPDKSDKPKDTIYKAAVSSYFNFFEKRNGIKPKFDGTDGRALKSLLNYFKSLHKTNGQGVEEKEFVINTLDYIFDNWDNQIDFIKNQTKLTQINSNINNIINRLKSEKSNTKTRNNGNKISGKSRPFTIEDFTSASENY